MRLSASALIGAIALLPAFGEVSAFAPQPSFLKSANVNNNNNNNKIASSSSSSTISGSNSRSSTSLNPVVPQFDCDPVIYTPNTEDVEVVDKCYCDARFPSLTMGFNMRWKASNCEKIYLCNTAEGVRQAVDAAISLYGAGSLKIISGGHCYENFVFNDSTKAVINVTPLLDWGYDDTKGYYLSSGDTNWGAFKKVFRHLGAVIPGGSCYSVGLGGHISGGGDGVLSRLHGLTVDWLSGVEVVIKDDPDADARIVYADANNEYSDLYWAHTGGGGGNFGVITKYYFSELPPAPEGVVVSVLHFDWSVVIDNQQGFYNVLDWYFDLAMDDDTEDKRRTVGKFQIHHKAAGEFQMYIQTSYYNIAQKIAAQELHYDLEDEINALLPTCEPTKVLGGHGGWFSFPKRKRKLFADKASFVTDETNVYPFYQSTQTINSSGPNQRGKYKSAYMIQSFPDDQKAAIWEWLTTTPSGMDESDLKDSLLQCDIFAGAINDKTSTETAIWQRQYYVKLQYQTYWQDSDKDSDHLGWIQGFYNDMYANYGGIPDPVKYPALFEGCYYNYPDVDLNDLQPHGKIGALYLYFLDNIERLSVVKHKYDPTDYFCHAQSIPPNPLEVAAVVAEIKANGQVSAPDDSTDS